MLRYLFVLIFSFSFATAQDYLRAPNSYVYDVDYAALNNFGGLTIPVKKAYQVWADNSGFLQSPIPSGSQSAAVYWEDVPGLIRSVSISGSGENASIKVAVNPGKGKGNALISLHVGSAANSSDPIFWTWHVWVTDDPTDGYEYSKGFETDLAMERFNPIHMDRNLGAVNAHFLGNNWHKSSGLFFQWGRKDPFPPLLHKDRSYYELNGVAGPVTDQDVNSPNNLHYQMKPRPSSDEGTNIKHAIQNPLDYMIDPQGTGTWFSEKAYKTTTPLIAWDLWSDNTRGGNSNANSSNPDISNDSKSYELKSIYDPCPGGWRVVSNYGREASNNNLSPYGRGGGGNDDIYNAWAEGQGFYLDPAINGGKPNSRILHTVENPVLSGLKVYPKLGFDFSEVNNRDLGLIPVSGRFVLYKTNGIFTNSKYQDELADGGFWSATYGSSHPRFAYFVADADQPDHGVGRYSININQIEYSSAGQNIRCIKDPNEDLIGYFGTNYIQTSEYAIYKEGLNNPNSYLIENSSQILEIPVNKAFSVYNQYFSENGEMLPSDDLKVNVLWTTNKDLIDKITLIPAVDAKNSKIKVEFKPNQSGNAVVSLHNGNINNPVYWSWHIWAPTTKIETLTYTTEDVIPAEFHIVNPTKSKFPPLTTEFMDRNLGAIESFPSVSNPSSPTQEEINQIKESGGFHFQWGRKDPIPSFQKVGSTETYAIYKGISINSAGEVNYQTITSADYDSFYTEEYANYASMAGVQNSDSKHSNATKVLKYAAENPLTFLYHGGQGISYTAPNAIDESNIRDWVSNSVGADGERSLLSNRWGHASKKSPFDPCPDGWRVPDYSVVLLKTSGKGTSPWYFGNNGSNGIDQRDFYNAQSTYGGKNVKVGSTFAGWNFDNEEFAIGNFPRTGTRGELGGAEISPTTGVWTAALSDYMIGYGLGMQMNKENYVRTGTGVYPQAGMNVRCAKDEPRYTAGENFLANEEIYITDDEVLMVYPNPVKDFLHIQSDEKFTYAIFDLNGSLMSEGNVQNQRIDFNSLPKGIYILILNNQLVKKIIKN